MTTKGSVFTCRQGVHFQLPLTQQIGCLLR
jgi:hypothetical protein